MNLLMIEFNVIVINTDQAGVERVVGVSPTYISVDKVKYFHRIDREFAVALHTNSSNLELEKVLEYTVFNFGNSENVLVAEPYKDIVEKLNQAYAIFQPRNING